MFHLTFNTRCLYVVTFLVCWAFTRADSKSKLVDASPQLTYSSDPCDPSEYCATGDIMPYPGNCQKYFWCVGSVWIAVDCVNGTLFDNVTKECTLPSAARCQPECPPVTATTPPRSTILPGACDEDNVTSCVNNQKYPDRSSCHHYYLCTGNRLVRVQCSIGTVFDIDVADCIPPSSSFDCYYRCRTPAPPTAEERTTGRDSDGTATSSSESGDSRPPTTITIEDAPTRVTQVTHLSTDRDTTGAEWLTTGPPPTPLPPEPCTLQRAARPNLKDLERKQGRWIRVTERSGINPTCVVVCGRKCSARGVVTTPDAIPTESTESWLSPNNN